MRSGSLSGVCSLYGSGAVVRSLSEQRSSGNGDEATNGNRAANGGVALFVDESAVVLELTCLVFLTPR